MHILYLCYVLALMRCGFAVCAVARVVTELNKNGIYGRALNQPN